MTEAIKPRKKKSQGTSRLLRLLRIVPALFSFFGNVLSLIRAEISQMRKQIAILILLAFFLFILMLSTWLSLNILLYLYLITLISSIACAVSIIALVNFILFVIVCCIISTCKVSTTFPETRKVLNDLIS